MLERWFQLSRHGTTPRTEVQAGIATFLTMAYIVVVNPGILAEAGVPFEGALFATCIAAAFASLLMGLIANYPFALAPGMGLNAYFAYSVVLGQGVTWQTALGAVFISGVVFAALTVARVRALIVDAVPDPIKVATAAGIGLFIAFIGLRNAGVVVGSPATLVTLGDFSSAPVLLALGGLIVTAALAARGIKAALILGILGVTIAAITSGLAPAPDGILSTPRPASTFLALDVAGALRIGLLDIVFVFLFVDMFDSVGSFMGLARQGGFIDRSGTMPRMNRALLADSLGTVGGAILGTSTVTTYIESAAGIGAGGRTGLTSVTVAALFILAAFATPLAAAIPPYATAPALILVGAMMMRAVLDVTWTDMTDAVPAFITMLAMPLTFSIANGLALGFITYPLVKLVGGRGREVRPLVWVLAGLFVVRFVYLGGA